MGLFSSLGWFKSQQQKEKEALELEAAKIQVSILQKKEAKLDAAAKTPLQLPSGKPYTKIKLINDVLTVVLLDGNICTKTNATAEDFNKARAASTEEELLKIVPTSEVVQEMKKIEAETKKAEKLIAGIDQLFNLDDFVVSEGSVYLKSEHGGLIRRSMPQLLVEKFASLVGEIKTQVTQESTLAEALSENEEYQALKKFWLKCCLNPNAQSAEDLYTFLSNHQFKIDRHGNFYAYRRVVSLEDGRNKALIDFVSNAYNKVKGVWKKKPCDYYVWQEDDGTYSFSKDHKDQSDGISAFIGNLQELYLNLPNMQNKMFTSAHTKQEDYRVGEIISMPRNDGDDNNHVSCSRGFHAASKAYNYSGFGDTPILVIINPMDVLAVPLGEAGKLRTCRWFFAMTLPENEQFILDDQDFDTMELGDIFEEKCSENLEDYVHNSFAEEVKRHTFTIPQMSGSDISKIVVSLEGMKSALSNRIVTLNNVNSEVNNDEDDNDGVDFDEF